MYIKNYELMNSFLMKGFFTKKILIRNFVRSFFFKKKKSTAMSTLLDKCVWKGWHTKKIWKKNNMCTWKNKQTIFWLQSESWTQKIFIIIENFYKLGNVSWTWKIKQFVFKGIGIGFTYQLDVKYSYWCFWTLGIFTDKFKQVF